MDIRSAGMQRKSDSTSNTLKRVEKADSYVYLFFLFFPTSFLGIAIEINPR